MPFIGNIIVGAGYVLQMLLQFYMFIVVCNALISWINPGPINRFVLVLRALSEPAQAPLRRLVPPYRFGIDLSPVLVIVIIAFMQYAVARNLILLGKMLGANAP